MGDQFPSLIGPLLDEREGSYANHPSDRGGETMWGVTAENARKYGYTGPMREMPRRTAERIMRLMCWEEPGLAAVSAYAPKLAAAMFDAVVHSGAHWPMTWAQRLLNGLNRQAKDYADIRVDGDFGGRSLAALDAYLTKRAKEGGEDVLVKGFNHLRGAYQVGLAEGRAANEDFLFGWLKNRS